MRRKITALLVALSVLPMPDFADPNPTGYLAYWDIQYIVQLGGLCQLSTYAYEPGGGLTPLEFSWHRSGEVKVYRSLRKYVPGELRIETAGAPGAWTIPLDADYPNLAPTDIERLLTNIGGGYQLVFTATPKDGAPIRYVATTVGAAATVAMFQACISSGREHPIPGDIVPEQLPPVATQSPDACHLGRSYVVGRASLSIDLTAFKDRGVVSLTTNPLLMHGSNKLRDPNEDPTPDPKLHIRLKPFVAELDDFYGTQLDSGKDPYAEYAITLAQLDTLEHELSQGGQRKLRARVKGETTINETFGGQFAVVPVAMFAGCRAALR